MSVIRGEMQLETADDFVDKLEQRVERGTFMDPSLVYRVVSETARLADASSYRAPAPRRSLHAQLVSNDAEEAAATDVRLELRPGRVRYEVRHTRGSLRNSVLLVLTQSIFLAIAIGHTIVWIVLASLAWLWSVQQLVKRYDSRRTIERQLQAFLREAAK